MIPDKAKNLKLKIKRIEKIVCTSNTISWALPENGNQITLIKTPLSLKFENNSKIKELQKLIQDHFDKMKLLEKPHHMNQKACRLLRDSFYHNNEIDGETPITYNEMSLLHFLGTWLGPTGDNHSEGHAIMNNLHYEIFGFHQYHGRQYSVNQDDWKVSDKKCGDKCQHETCLKHAKNETLTIPKFYKTNDEVFSSYSNYLNYFKENNKAILKKL
ncbi:MAG: hypothetical protein KKG76_06080 [Euryarchaeota archaeon]|nr:hypothetical protein [Euryarchaeota archaeon]